MGRGLRCGARRGLPARIGFPLDYERMYEYRFRGIDQSARESVWGRPIRGSYGSGSVARSVCSTRRRARRVHRSVPARERWAIDVVDSSPAPDVPCHGAHRLTILEAELPERTSTPSSPRTSSSTWPRPRTRSHAFRYASRRSSRPAAASRSSARTSATARATTSTAPTTRSRSRTSRSREHLYAAGFDATLIAPLPPLPFRGPLPVSAVLDAPGTCAPRWPGGCSASSSSSSPSGPPRLRRCAAG